MPETYATTIRASIARYTAGEWTLQELEDWFVPAIWDIRRHSDVDALQLSDEVTGILVDPDLTEEQRRAELRLLVTTVRTQA